MMMMLSTDGEVRRRCGEAKRTYLRLIEMLLPLFGLRSATLLALRALATVLAD